MTDQNTMRLSMGYAPLKSPKSTYVYQDPISYQVAIPLSEPLSTKSGYTLTNSYPLLYYIFAATEQAILEKNTSFVTEKELPYSNDNLIDISAYQQRSFEDIEEAMFNEGLFCFHDVLTVADIVNNTDEENSIRII